VCAHPDPQHDCSFEIDKACVVWNLLLQGPFGAGLVGAAVETEGVSEAEESESESESGSESELESNDMISLVVETLSPMFGPRVDVDAVRRVENETAAAAVIASGADAELALQGAGGLLPGETDEDVANVTMRTYH